MTTRSLILVLGDQLSPHMSSLRAGDPNTDRILMCEVDEEARYVRHHKKKIVFILSAMRHFAEELSKAGWHVDYVKLDDDNNSGSFTGEVKRAIERLSPQRVIMTQAGEWRVMELARGWAEAFGIPVELPGDDRFICSHAMFDRWARGRKQLRMEYFYREMRKHTGLLMEADTPVGGKWNFDAENRKPADRDLFMPRVPTFAPDAITKDVQALVTGRFADHFGDIEPFGWPVTRESALEALEHFIDQALPSFGDYQDAMLVDEPHLYHSLLSPMINVGLLDPLEVCRRAEAAWHDGRAPLNAVEGFIRQIIGWREFVRGIYWMHMPDYAQSNALDARRDLPNFYWTGKTDMKCMAQVIDQPRREAYAHHIQRLMVTGNFAMLAGVEPRQIHEWYLEVYADAYEWVEMPNVIGMSQFADGGLFASKPYAASGAYIDRMSDYCGSCRYDVASKTGEDACPFNALYWDFLARNEAVLRENRRLARAYANWDRMQPEKRTAYRQAAKRFLDAL